MHATKTTTTHATYEAFYAKQQRNLIGLLISRFGLQEWDAQELAQEAFLIAWRNWGLLASKCELERKTWLTTVACRKVIDRLRRKRTASRFSYSAKELHNYVTHSIGRGFEANAGRTDGDTMEIAGEFLLAQPEALNTEAQLIIREDIAAALDSLTHTRPQDKHPQRSRETLVLVAMGYTREEIAKMQKRSVAAVKTDLHRIRHSVKASPEPTRYTVTIRKGAAA